MIDCILLGCGATMPLPARALSALVLRCCGRGILFDCGEGTQTALRREKVSPLKLDVIALTHYHGDHIFGLPGLLQTMSCLGRREALTLTGPPGLESALSPILELAAVEEFEIRLAEDSALSLHDLHPVWPEGAALTAFPTEHRVPSVGYVFSLPRPPKFMPERAEALGVAKSDWKTIIREPDALYPCASGMVKGRELLGAERRGLKVVFSGDTRPCPSLRAAARDADLLVHDATYASHDDRENAILYGHSLFREAAELAASAAAQRLWLTHFSQTIVSPKDALPEAQAVFPAAECGFDGKRVTLRYAEE